MKVTPRRLKSLWLKLEGGRPALAVKLLVSDETVRSWYMGRRKPRELYQKKLAELFEEHGVK